jgi:hypothetical protein
MEACAEEEIRLHAFLTSALDGDEWSASQPGRLNARERAPRLRGTYSRSVCLKRISWTCRSSTRSVVTTQTACAIRAWQVRTWIIFIWHRICNMVNMITKPSGSVRGTEWPAERIIASNISLHYGVCEVSHHETHGECEVGGLLLLLIWPTSWLQRRSEQQTTA